jgi:hypothetical protein
VKLGKRSMAIIAIAPMLDVPEPVVVTHAEGMNDLFREMTFRCELVEPLDRCLDPVPPGPVLLGFAGVRSRRPAWARLSTRITAGSSKPWPTNVTRMTENVKKRMRSRPPPAGVLRGRRPRQSRPAAVDIMRLPFGGGGV